MTLLSFNLRLWLRRSGMFLLFLVVLYAVGRPVQIWLDGFYSGERGPYLQMPSTNAMTIRWQSQDEYAGVIYYGVAADQLTQSIKEERTGYEHEIRLTGLKPATRYYYRAGKESEPEYKGQDFWFVTAPASEQSFPFRFWVTGDQGYPNIIQQQVRDAAKSWAKQHTFSLKRETAFDFWLTTGDNAYRSGSNQQFQDGFFEPYKDILRNTVVWPAYGNHDARRWVFFDLFTLPTQAESGGVASGTEHYYSFDYANLHVVMLDSEASDLSTDSAMVNWLKQDLNQTRQQWLIAILHHPPYTKGTHDSDNKWDSNGRLVEVRENILPVLEKAGVDLVFSGHSHMYERSDLINCHYGDSLSFNKNFVRQKNSYYAKRDNKTSSFSGTVYTVVGSSSKLDSGKLDHPALPYSYHEAGSMIVDINKNKLNAYFVNKNGKVSDKFEIIKGAKAGVTSRQCNQ